MPIFKFTGKNRAGVAQKGEIDAADQTAALNLLRRRG